MLVHGSLFNSRLQSSAMAADLSTRLIEAVRGKRPLWDSGHPQHNERVLINSLWDQVACSVGISREAAKSKWRSLRDYYRHEQRKAEAWTIGEYKSSWNQYERLSFLKESMQRGKRLYNLLSLQSDASCALDQLPVEAVVKVEYDESEMESEPHMRIGDAMSLASHGPDEPSAPFDVEDDGNVEEVVGRPYQDESPPLSSISQNSGKINSLESSGYNSRKLLRRRTITNLECLELKRRKVAALEKIVEENENDDLQFFRSLIPDLKDLPRRRKACIRLKIQELVYKELYGDQQANEKDTVEEIVS